MDYDALRQKVGDWMMDRGWKRITAKRGQYNQSLFEHTMYELDVLLVLWPILMKGWQLEDTDFASLLIGIVAHDVGKATPEWQSYVLAAPGTAKYVPHIIEDLTQSTVDELFDDLGLQGARDDAKAFVRYHMQAARTTDSLLLDVINCDGKTDRWMTLAKLVDQIDSFCSANGLLAAIGVLERPPIGRYIRTAYHLVQLRGVTTTLLHRAAIESFESLGWSPLLHFSNGSIYVTESTNDTIEPTAQDIVAHLATLIDTVMGVEFAELVVARDFRASPIAMPPLFDWREIQKYLTRAATRVRGGENRYEQSIRSAGGRPGVERMICDYLSYWSGTTCLAVDGPTLVHESQRISRAYPEIVIFKFFKAAVDVALVGEDLTPEAQLEYAARLPTVAGGRARELTSQYVAQVEYDGTFGAGAFDMLRQTGTLSAAKDMAFTVDKYWSRPGHEFGLDTERVEHAPDARRLEALISALVEIAGRVYESVPPGNRPTRASAVEIANCFMLDLLHPTAAGDLVGFAGDQLAAYRVSKFAAKCPRGREHLCPICNTRFGPAEAAKAAYLDKPESHTNRAVSHGSPGYIVVCPACTYERFIQQLVLRAKPDKMLVLLPRMNISQGSGAGLVRKALELANRANSLMAGGVGDPNAHLSVTLTQLTARKLADRNVFGMTMEELLDLFTYQASNSARKKALDALAQEVRDEYGEAVSDLNDGWGTSFRSWDDAIAALAAGEVLDSTALAIRAEAYGLRPSMQFVCQTPHMVLIPLSSKTTDNDSDVNRAIRDLFVMLILGLALDCTVAVLGSGEGITFLGGEGVAHVPGVPALRDLIGSDWVSLDRAELWLRAVGAASLLAQAAHYPERSNLYQILNAPTPGHILRRIEQQSETGYVSHQQLQHLRTLEEVLR